jgi:hypothetical protein
LAFQLADFTVELAQRRDPRLTHFALASRGE